MTLHTHTHIYIYIYIYVSSSDHQCISSKGTVNYKWLERHLEGSNSCFIQGLNRNLTSGAEKNRNNPWRYRLTDGIWTRDLQNKKDSDAHSTATSWGADSAWAAKDIPPTATPTQAGSCSSCPHHALPVTAPHAALEGSLTMQPDWETEWVPWEHWCSVNTV